MNLEMAVTDEMLSIALQVLPQDVCLVPERREERTTEGGLEVAGNLDQIKNACKTMTNAGIRVSLFIAPENAQIEAAKAAGAPVIELHTGTFADTAINSVEQLYELQRIRDAVTYAHKLGLIVNAGHGLNIHNVQAIAAIPRIEELNIGHAIVAHSLFVGWDFAIREMKALLKEAAGK